VTKRGVLVSLLLLGSLALASMVGPVARTSRHGADAVPEPPFAPSPASAPFASLGYRDLGADLLWVRLVGYAGEHSIAGGVVALLAEHGLDADTIERVAQLLEQGHEHYPDYWRFPFNAGQVYALDLRPLVSPGTDEHRRYSEQAVTWLDRAVRLPEAPASAAVLAANMLTDLGRVQQAEAKVRELILTENDQRKRNKLIDKLARMRSAAPDVVRDATRRERESFVAEWETQRPALPASVYVVLGPRSGWASMAELQARQLMLSAPPAPPPLPALADDVGEVIDPAPQP